MLLLARPQNSGLSIMTNKDGGEEGGDLRMSEGDDGICPRQGK